jgi:AcrR family transcriptional regulator
MPSRPALSPEFIAAHKQRRIMDALAELCAERGYEATKISDIVRRARVARKTLYDNFEGKEEVFLAAFDAARDEAMARVEESCAAADGWRAGVEAGLGAFLGYVAEKPVLARMCMVEALSATPAATERYEQALAAFVALAEQSLPEIEGLPETMDETLVGGVAWIVYQRIRREEARDAVDLLPELTEFVTAPYLQAGGDAQPGRSADEKR